MPYINTNVQQYNPQQSTSVADSLRNFFSSTPGQFNQLPTMKPWQQEIGQNAAQTAWAGMKQTPDIDRIAGAITDRYKNELMPTMAAELGGMGLGSSSAMENAMGQAQRGYQNDLAQLGYQNYWNRQNQLMGMLNQGMQPQFQYSYTEPQQSQFMQVLPAIMSAVVGAYSGNPAAILSALPDILKLLGGQQGQQGQFNAGGPLPGLSSQQPIKLF
jgi:hypothetical protein